MFQAPCIAGGFSASAGLHVLSLPLTWMRAAIFLRMRGVGEENRKRSFREMLAESALATAMTMWRKLEEKVKNVRTAGIPQTQNQ